MQYRFETTYDQKALSVMAKCIRKTARKSKSRRSHIFGWIVVVLALFLSFSSGEEGFSITFNKVITWNAALAIIAALIFEDQLNGYFAGKRMLKGTETAISTFDTNYPDTFLSETAIGKSEFSYGKVLLTAETERYFVFVFSANHAQIYDKQSLSGGSAGAFRDFICEKTQKTVIPVK